MVILDPYGMIFDDVGVFGLAFHLLFKSCLSILWTLGLTQSLQTLKIFKNQSLVMFLARMDVNNRFCEIYRVPVDILI